ncbi:MAG: insulinase family protein [Burkholderiales bacterium]|nr:insulinase family protein [Burkholderiales bacterium]
MSASLKPSRPALLVLVLAWLAGAALAQPALPPGVVAGPAMGGIAEYRLANGFTVLLLPDRSQPLITTNMTYLVGSRHEGYGEAGMAHLLEHLLFKGTPERRETQRAHVGPRATLPGPAATVALGRRDIKREFVARGARWNGTTYYDRTNYFLTFAATADNLDWAISLEADRMVNSFVTREDLDSEMTVVRNEFESGENSAARVLMQKTANAAFEWHNYGRAVIGNRSDIENVPIERLQAFYRTYYQPDNAVMVIAGDFDPAAALALVAARFGAIPKPARPLPRTYTQDAAQEGEREVVLRRLGENQILTAFYHAPPGTHPDYAAFDVLAQVLGDTPTGRLHKALVETRLATGVGGGDRMLAERGALVFSATTTKDAPLAPLREAFIATIENLAANPVSADEVARARQKMLTQMDVIMTRTQQFATQLSEWIALGDWRFFFRYRDHLNAVSADAVNAAARTHLIRSNRTLGIFAPESTPPARAAVPPPPDLKTALKDYRGPAGIASGEGEAFDPSPATIDARTRRFALANGLKVAFLPKKSRGGMVSATLAFQYGTEESKAGRAQACGFAGAMLMRGTRSRSREELRNEITRLRANLNVGGTGASLEVPAAGLADSLRLVAEILREPRFDAGEFEQLKRASLAGIESGRSDPAARAGMALARHLNPYSRGHWSYASTIDEQIEDTRGATLEAARACHADFFGLSHAQLAIVGDFDEATLRPLLEELFGAWSSPRPYARIPNRVRAAPAINENLAAPDKANATLRGVLVLDARDDDPDYPALVLANYLFGGSIDARLAARIREKDGLSYSVGSGLSVSSFDRFGQWSVSAIFAPQNRARVEAALMEEIARARTQGFSEEEVARGRQGLLSNRRIGRASDGALAGKLSSDLFLGRTLAWDAALEARLAALSAAEVSAAFARHIDPARLNLVKAGDFR